MIKFTKVHRRLEIVSFLILLFIMVFFFWYWFYLPEKVPVHFGINGIPNRWGSPMELLVVPGTALFVYLMMTIVLFIPVRFWNVPCKITEKNRTFVYSTSFSLLQTIKLETMILMAILVVYTSNLKGPTLWLVISYLAILFLTIVFFLIKLVRA